MYFEVINYILPSLAYLILGVAWAWPLRRRSVPSNQENGQESAQRGGILVKTAKIIVDASSILAFPLSACLILYSYTTLKHNMHLVVKIAYAYTVFFFLISGIFCLVVICNALPVNRKTEIITLGQAFIMEGVLFFVSSRIDPPLKSRLHFCLAVSALCTGILTIIVAFLRKFRPLASISTFVHAMWSMYSGSILAWVSHISSDKKFMLTQAEDNAIKTALICHFLASIFIVIIIKTLSSYFRTERARRISRRIYRRRPSYFWRRGVTGVELAFEEQFRQESPY